MAFNRNDPADLLALKNEVNNDPIAMGYAAVVDESLTELLLLLNEPINNATPEDGATTLTCEDLLKMLFAENISAGDQFRVQLIFEMTEGADSDISRFKPEISALDTGLANAINAHTRALSRAEILFSDPDVNGVKEFVSISRDDWIAARDS